MVRDTLFENRKTADKFTFDDRVAEVFDDMLDRSVPHYRQVTEMTAEILQQSLLPGDTVYDLGCSTGTTLIALAKKLAAGNFRFVGMDNSRAMLDKAVRKAEMFSLAAGISFEERDITRTRLSGAGGVILNYTLQFIKPTARQGLLEDIHAGMRQGGILILSEKVTCRDSILDEQFLAAYFRFKKGRGYSELEIANKRDALEDVLIPCTIGENREMLEQAGFTRVMTFFQWFNFASFMAIK